MTITREGSNEPFPFVLFINISNATDSKSKYRFGSLGLITQTY